LTCPKSILAILLDKSASGAALLEKRTSQPLIISSMKAFAALIFERLRSVEITPAMPAFAFALLVIAARHSRHSLGLPA
jgi:hypothetical protein